jgi:hypothetical protein
MPDYMVLPDFVLTSRQNKTWKTSGKDSLKYCEDKKHFKSYPHDIEYQYNSRGFRDTEWPTDLTELQNAIWCFGDSFTVGIGSPLTHTWVNILQSRTGQRCINVSLDGASNAWIARKAIKAIEVIKPSLVVIQWSYITRAEHHDTTKTDEDRRLHFTPGSLTDDPYDLSLSKWKYIMQSVEHQKQNTKLLHSFIPYALVGIDELVSCRDVAEKLWNELSGPAWPPFPKSVQEFNEISEIAITDIKSVDPSLYTRFKNYFDVHDLLSNFTHIPEIKILDYARDGYHYDLITATDFVDKLVNLI